MRAVAPRILALGLVACAGSRSPTTASREPTEPHEPAGSGGGSPVPVATGGPPPVAPPVPGAQGCVPEPDYAAYGKALDSHARGELDRVLAGHGAQAVNRAAFTVGGDDAWSRFPVGHSYEVKGRHYLVVGMAIPSIGSNHTATIAITRDGTVRPLETAETSYPVMVHACLPCDPGRGAADPDPAPLVVELQPGESPGPELHVTYTRWYADYTNRRCHHHSPPP